MTRCVRRTVEVAFPKGDILLSFPDLIPLLDSQTMLLSVIGGRVQRDEVWDAVNMTDAEMNERLRAKSNA